ncbi:MAG: hypothetical protein ABSB91_03920 [Sedimentisphaerales bacterium]
MITGNKKTGFRTSSSRQKQREDSYAGGEIFVLYQRWFWNCLPWVNTDSRQNDDIYLAQTAEENTAR